MDFHDKHYSANRMKLVVLGRESLDVLEGWAADLFAGVRNKDLPQNRWEDEKPFGEKDLLTQCFAKPVMDSRQLDLSFPFIALHCLTSPCHALHWQCIALDCLA